MIDRDTFSLYGLSIGILFFLLFIISEPPENLSYSAWITAGVAILMTIWWVTEAVPIYVTGIIPIILFPFFNIFEIQEISNSYAHPLVLLFLGGFIIASAMESCGLHKRIAINILSISGTSPSKIIAGFMIATASISMWVSNTASTIMMLPIATSVIAIFANQMKSEESSLTVPLLLAIAYSASIGGVATLIGTPTNVMLASILSENYNYDISFFDWFKVGFPVTIILLPVVWFFLTNIIFKVPNNKSDALQITLAKLKEDIGKSSNAEKIVAMVFILTASLWMLRRFINSSFDLNINDTSIGLFGALLLFIIPIKKNQRACSWDTANKIPWGVLLLVGGGIALSKAFNITGLANWIGSFSLFFDGYNIFILIIIFVALIIFLTELNSNTATIATFAPILIAFAIGINVNPLFFAIPCTIAASCAFMLPVATPPNAVIFGSGKISIKNMVKAGIILNIISIFLVTIISYFLLKYFFNYEIYSVPIIFIN